MEFPSDMEGEKIVCPHCNKLTTLGTAKPIQAVQTPAALRGVIKRKSEVAGMGCVIQFISLIVVWFFPIGTMIAIALFIIGSAMSRRLVCSQCGTTLSSRKIKICPSCHANF
jgi:ribosomal protein L37AE/L43A